MGKGRDERYKPQVSQYLVASGSWRFLEFCSGKNRDREAVKRESEYN
jgi:hypothetical protein